MTTSTARRLWTLYEPYHAVVYFAPQVEAALKDAPIRAVGNELGAAVSGSPRLALWQATTTLRGHRGDGHVTALTAAGLDGCRAQVLAVAAGSDRQWLQPGRTRHGRHRTPGRAARTDRGAHRRCHRPLPEPDRSAPAELEHRARYGTLHSP